MFSFAPFAFAVLLQVAPAPLNSPPALYAIENLASEHVYDETRLVRLSMDRENKLVKENLLTTDFGFFGGIGGHRIASGRFIVTQYGGVIDIQTRKVVHNEWDGRVLGLEDGKVFYRLGSAFQSSALFCFDLKEHKVAKVEKGGHWDLPGLQSPDGTMSIETDRSHNGMIRLHRLGKKPMDLVKAAHFTYSPFSAEIDLGQTPCLWLDGEHILAGQTNRKLVILTTQGAVEASIEIKDAPMDIFLVPSLERDPQGRVIYYCDAFFLIDIPNRSASPLKSFWLGHGFEASVAVDQYLPRSVFHDGKAIGRWVFNPYQAIVAPGLLAFPYVRPRERANLGYPDGIAVWNSRAGGWQTIDMHVNNLIGWSK